MVGHRQKVFYLVFALSGFSGLIYESIWTHYLKLFLGHAAYAQTLVIAIFMGGMALGAWLCSRYTMRWSNLFIGYAIVEGVVGIFALFFHELFDQSLRIAFTSLLPALGSPTTINLAKWALAGLLILPQTILLGMTFPLMSGAMIRCYPKAPGRSLGMLYFTNSIGAAIGVLVSGFLLINLLGLPGTIRSAGVINIVLAVIVWALSRGLPRKSTPLQEAVSPSPPYPRQYYFLLLVALLTGTASFIYEIGWIRMLSMVLGSSTHAFELMLSSFLFGLAFGSLWVKNRIDRTSSPLKLLAFIQVLMGVFAAATLPLYDQTFHLMHWLINTLEASSTGYLLYMLSGNGIALLIMFPTTFCAGMTLPLITSILYKQHNGEKNIGAVYAVNTVGAIIGVFFAVHVGMPLLGLKNLILSGAAIDVALGLILFWCYCRNNGWQKKPVYVFTLLTFLLVAIGTFAKLDPYKMASAIYRKNDFLTENNSKIIYHKDGKTATVSLTLSGKYKLSIRTNGKTDASINIGVDRRIDSDDATQIQLAAIPMALHPEAKTVANIGFGSGITTNVVLRNPRITQVDTVEIEPFIVEAARNFGPRVDLAYTDPRSKIHIADAKTFFAARDKRYDIIISEPSNPWVSGVANLFTREFYKSLLPALEDDGIFAQWVQLYEIDLELLGSIIKAISVNFSDYSIYVLDQADLLIVAKRSGKTGSLSPEIFNIPEISRELQFIDVNSPHDVNFRRIGSKKTLQPYFDRLATPVNSDYFPVLDQGANRVHFLKLNATEITSLNHLFFPLADMLEGKRTVREVTQITPTRSYNFTSNGYAATQLRDYFFQNQGLQSNSTLINNLQFEAQAIIDMCRGSYSGPDYKRLSIIYNQGIRILPYLSAGETQRVLDYWESLGAQINLPPEEYAWLSLFRAISAQNGSGMKIHASTLLLTENLLAKQTDFLIASALTGALLSGDVSWADKNWKLFKKTRFEKDPLPLFFQVLEAQIDEHVQSL